MNFIQHMIIIRWLRSRCLMLTVPNTPSLNSNLSPLVHSTLSIPIPTTIWTRFHVVKNFRHIPKNLGYKLLFPLSQNYNLLTIFLVRAYFMAFYSPYQILMLYIFNFFCLWRITTFVFFKGFLYCHPSPHINIYPICVIIANCCWGVVEDGLDIAFYVFDLACVLF